MCIFLAKMLNDLSIILFSPQVFEGHPFIVEAGVSVGGKDVKQVSSCILIGYVGRLCYNSWFLKG